jgi:hypothetical protein
MPGIHLHRTKARLGAHDNTCYISKRYIRSINHNIVDNALGGRSSFLLMPSLYQRAYLLTHETGEVTLTDDFVAPDEDVTAAREAQVNIITSTR